MISLLAVFMLTGSRARGLRLRLMIVLQDGTKELLNTRLMSSYQTSIVVVIEVCKLQLGILSGRGYWLCK